MPFGYHLAGVAVDCVAHTITAGSLRVELTRNEMRLLVCLVSNIQGGATLEQIAADVWDHSVLTDTGSYRQGIRALRQKLRRVTDRLVISHEADGRYRLVDLNYRHSSVSVKVITPAEALEVPAVPQLSTDPLLQRRIRNTELL